MYIRQFEAVTFPSYFRKPILTCITIVHYIENISLTVALNFFDPVFIGRSVNGVSLVFEFVMRTNGIFRLRKNKLQINTGGLK